MPNIVSIPAEAADYVNGALHDAANIAIGIVKRTVNEKCRHLDICQSGTAFTLQYSKTKDGKRLLLV